MCNFRINGDFTLLFFPDLIIRISTIDFNRAFGTLIHMDPLDILHEYSSSSVFSCL